MISWCIYASFVDFGYISYISIVSHSGNNVYLFVMNFIQNMHFGKAGGSVFVRSLFDKRKLDVYNKSKLYKSG